MPPCMNPPCPPPCCTCSMSCGASAGLSCAKAVAAASRLFSKNFIVHIDTPSLGSFRTACLHHISILYLPAVVWKRGFCRRRGALRAPAPITEAQRPRGTFPPYPQRKVLLGASRVRPGARLNGQLRGWEETYNCVRPHQSLAYLTRWEFISRWKRNLGKGKCH